MRHHVHLASSTRADRVFSRADNPHGPGRCWHCGAPLNREHRKQGTTGAWHVDHWPVRKCDIEGQWLWGTRDKYNENNMVPACAPCNTSHRWERRRWYWAGRSQCRCAAAGVIWGLLGGALLCAVRTI